MSEREEKGLLRGWHWLETLMTALTLIILFIRLDVIPWPHVLGGFLDRYHAIIDFLLSWVHPKSWPIWINDLFVLYVCAALAFRSSLHHSMLKDMFQKNGSAKEALFFALWPLSIPFAIFIIIAGSFGAVVVGLTIMSYFSRTVRDGFEESQAAAWKGLIRTVPIQIVGAFLLEFVRIVFLALMFLLVEAVLEAATEGLPRRGHGDHVTEQR